MTSWLDRWVRDPRQLRVADLRGVPRLGAVLARNLYWVRTHGWADLIEEHDLNPAVRVPREWKKWRWRRRFAVGAGTALPVFVVGAQRSGTNMLTYGLDMAPEFETYNEGNRRAFSNYRLRQDRLGQVVARSRHRFVLFKPLLDSHLTPQLLDRLVSASPPRAIWVYRGVRDRVRSALAKFGDSNLSVLRRYGEDPQFRHWQLGGERGLSPESESILARFDLSSLGPADGAALFWLIRNRLVFDLKLHQRDDVLLVSYDAFVRSPPAEMTRICEFLGFPFRPELVQHVRPRFPTAIVESISQAVLELCDDLARELDQVAASPDRPAMMPLS